MVVWQARGADQMRRVTLVFYASVILIHSALLAQPETISTPNPKAIIWQPWLSSSATVLVGAEEEATNARFNPKSDLVAINSKKVVVIRRVADGQEVRRFHSANQWCPSA